VASALSDCPLFAPCLPLHCPFLSIAPLFTPPVTPSLPLLRLLPGMEALALWHLHGSHCPPFPHPPWFTPSLPLSIAPLFTPP